MPKTQRTPAAPQPTVAFEVDEIEDALGVLSEIARHTRQQIFFSSTGQVILKHGLLAPDTTSAAAVLTDLLNLRA